jgi:hypothetical protein
MSPELVTGPTSRSTTGGPATGDSRPSFTIATGAAFTPGRSLEQATRHQRNVQRLEKSSRGSDKMNPAISGRPRRMRARHDRADTAVSAGIAIVAIAISRPNRLDTLHEVSKERCLLLVWDRRRSAR